MAESKKQEKDEPKKVVVDLGVAARLAQGILSSASVSHRDVELVSQMAVAQARSLAEHVEKANA